jgi:hypothetical protein
MMVKSTTPPPPTWGSCLIRLLLFISSCCLWRTSLCYAGESFKSHLHHGSQQQQRQKMRGRRRRGRNRQIHRTCPTTMAAFVERDLWAIRIASASLTYFGFVAYNDRPRGALLIDNPQQSMRVQQSLVPGAGLGLFATKAIPKGTALGTYPGVVIPLQQNLVKLQQYPLCEGYIWRFSDNQFVIDPTDQYGNIQDVCLGGNPSMVLSIPLFTTLLRFVSVPTTLCRINEPPKGRDVNVVTEEDLLTRTVTFLVERDVYEGEELYIDYGLSYDRSMYGGSARDG